jgi:hypothetical protein
MASASAPYFFMSYSREDIRLQQRIVAELRGRGIIIWVDHKYPRGNQTDMQ